MLERIALRAGRKQPNRRSPKADRTGLRIESLEARMLMTANSADPSQFTLSHGSGACHCPICTGEGLDTIPSYEAAPTAGSYSAAGLAAASPLTAVPALSSRPGATAKIYLDFNGHTEAAWGEFRNVVTPAYDVDGDRSSFSATELANIQQIWARVAEDYSPFNIDVTTIDPGNFANKVAVRVAIGGNHSDWFKQGAGGVAYIGGFYNSASNVAYVFEDALGNGNPRSVAEAASHEAGHTFGLQHQSLWSGSRLVSAYNEGNASWAPIMGVGYYSARTTWHSGATSNGPTSYQDDLAILANTNNGFGYRADDWGNTAATASALVGTSVNVAGVIERAGDLDMFSFNTGGGAVNLTLNVAQVGANLDAELRLQRADGSVIVAADPTNSLGASISTTLAAGTYYVVARGSSTVANTYGNLGQYTITGTLPGGGGGGVTPVPTSPEINIQIAGASVADGGTALFGNTTVGAAVTRTFTITNTGNAPLSLSTINAANLPAGFSLVSNIPTTSLAAGASTSFTVRLNATAAGSFGGTLSIVSNDSDESPYDLVLSGTVAAAPQQAVVRTIDNGAAGFTTSGYWFRQTGAGRESDIHYAYRGSGSAVATWNFTGLPAGTYRVYASYPANRAYATNAPFSVYNGGSLVGTKLVNQEALPTTVIDGTRYALLGTYTITGNQLVVRLTNAANQTVVADAIRIEQVTTAGASLGRGTLAGRGLGPEAVAVDLVHGEKESPAGETSAVQSRSNLADRLGSVTQQLTALTARLQSDVNLRAADHIFTQSAVAPGGSSSSRAGESDLDWLLADESDWLS